MVDVLRDRWLEPSEPVTAFECDSCGMEIYEGEIYFKAADGNNYCHECCYSRRAEREEE